MSNVEEPSKTTNAGPAHMSPHNTTLERTPRGVWLRFLRQYISQRKWKLDDDGGLPLLVAKSLNLPGDADPDPTTSGSSADAPSVSTGKRAPPVACGTVAKKRIPRQPEAEDTSLSYAIVPDYSVPIQIVFRTNVSCDKQFAFVMYRPRPGGTQECAVVCRNTWNKYDCRNSDCDSHDVVDSAGCKHILAVAQQLLNADGRESPVTSAFVMTNEANFVIHSRWCATFLDGDRVYLLTRTVRGAVRCDGCYPRADCIHAQHWAPGKPAHASDRQAARASAVSGFDIHAGSVGEWQSTEALQMENVSPNEAAAMSYTAHEAPNDSAARAGTCDSSTAVAMDVLDDGGGEQSDSQHEASSGLDANVEANPRNTDDTGAAAEDDTLSGFVSRYTPDMFLPSQSKGRSGFVLPTGDQNILRSWAVHNCDKRAAYPVSADQRTCACVDAGHLLLPVYVLACCNPAVVQVKVCGIRSCRRVFGTTSAQGIDEELDFYIGKINEKNRDKPYALGITLSLVRRYAIELGCGGRNIQKLYDSFCSAVASFRDVLSNAVGQAQGWIPS